MLTAREVVDRLQSLASSVELAKVRKRLPADEPAIGNRMKDVFDTAASAAGLPVAEWELLVAEPTYEARLAAFSILDFRSRRAPASDELAALYNDHHDRITTWDMVDRAAPRVIGSWVAGGPYDVLEDLAGSADPLRRRTAMTAPLWFTRQDDPADLAAGFALAARLCTDPDPTVHKPVGIYLAYAGEKDRSALDTFLQQHGESMPAAARRLALRKS